MARTTKKTSEEKTVVTRAEKRDATKNLIREVLKNGAQKSNDLIDNAAKLYSERFAGEETSNDVKGRVGSVLDVMKKENEILFDGGVYALKAEEASVTEEEASTEKSAKRTTKKTVKNAETEEQAPLKKTRKTTKKATEGKAEEVKPETLEQEKTEEKPAPKKRGRKAKAEVKEEPKTDDVQAATAEVEKTEAKEGSPAKEEIPVKEEKTEIPVEIKAEIKEEPKKAEDTSPKGTLMDMSFLFGDIKPVKREERKPEVKPETKAVEKVESKEEKKSELKAEENPTEKEEKKPEGKAEGKTEIKTESKPPVKTEQKPAIKREQPKNEPKKPQPQNGRKNGGKTLTADEKLQEAFLNRLHRLGGEYFEYYSVYLLERYSRMNGRRLEMLKVTAGDRDGGIDGEIELTDRLGFKETIYIQAKNWDPDKGDEKLWVVGETLLQQFIGACVCRQAKDGKQHCRGIFITTSRFTPEAKKMLDDTSDKFVGYDGTDLYETAKECGFGIVKKNGEWTLDEQLLSGTKAFFNML